MLPPQPPCLLTEASFIPVFLFILAAHPCIFYITPPLSKGLRLGLHSTRHCRKHIRNLYSKMRRQTKSGKGKRRKMGLTLSALRDSELHISFHCFCPLVEHTSSYCCFQIHLFWVFHQSQFNGAVPLPPPSTAIPVLVWAATPWTGLVICSGWKLTLQNWLIFKQIRFTL